MSGYELDDHRARPPMARRTDPVESYLHEAATPKQKRMLIILGRLADGSKQTYTTLCDFGQTGGPATNRGLLTELERRGFVRKEGRIGLAAAFVITPHGRDVIGEGGAGVTAGNNPAPPRPPVSEAAQLELL